MADLDLITVLTRIAVALERAYPEKKISKPIRMGVAEYKYEDQQTVELRKLAAKSEDEITD